MDSPFRQHGVCCHWLVLTLQIACDKPLLFNAKSAWQTQLFLYIRLTRIIAVVSAQQQHLPFYIPHFVKHSVIILRSELRNILTFKLSNYWSSSFPLHFQPGNLFFFAPLFHCCLFFLLDIFAFVQLVLVNRLMQSISPLSFLHYNLNLHYSAQVLWEIFSCCCFVLYCYVCDLACVYVSNKVHEQCLRSDRWWQCKFWTGLFPCGISACQQLHVSELH